MNNTEHMRARLLDAAGVYAPADPKLQQQAEERVRRFNGPGFLFMVREADARIRMGTFRYERMPLPWPTLARLGLVDGYVTKLRQKLDRYEATGNQEMLVDALNYIRMEFIEPCRENTYYESEERYD